MRAPKRERRNCIHQYYPPHSFFRTLSFLFRRSRFGARAHPTFLQVLFQNWNSCCEQHTVPHRTTFVWPTLLHRRRQPSGRVQIPRSRPGRECHRFYRADFEAQTLRPARWQNFRDSAEIGQQDRAWTWGWNRDSRTRRIVELCFWRQVVSHWTTHLDLQKRFESSGGLVHACGKGLRVFLYNIICT